MQFVSSPVNGTIWQASEVYTYKSSREGSNKRRRREEEVADKLFFTRQMKKLQAKKLKKQLKESFIYIFIK